METFNDLMVAVLAILPDAVIEEDAYGQLVVHTGLREATGGSLSPFHGEDGPIDSVD